MRYLKGYKNYNNINEEFIMGAIKGALSKLMKSFGDAFKDISSDFKKTFNGDEPSTIKDIIITNFNQAVDGAQKQINDKAIDESAVNGMLNTMLDGLVTLAKSLDKDIDSALGTSKSAGAKVVAKAVLLGSKEAKWAGIVGLIDPSNAVALKSNGGIKITGYKWSKTVYETTLTNAAKSAGSNSLKARKDAASKFLDNLQKDIVNQVEKEFSDEEVDKAYKYAMDKAKQGGGDYKVGDNVIYKRDTFNKDNWSKIGEDDRKNINDGPVKKMIDDQEIGVKKIASLQGDDVGFEGVDWKKKLDDILLKVEGTETEDVKKAAESLGKIKSDPEKMKKVASYSDFLQDEKNKDKVDQIEKIIKGEV